MKKRSLVVKLLALASAGFSFIVIRNFLNKTRAPEPQKLIEKSESPRILLETPTSAAPPSPSFDDSQEDDLTKIAGIGPKYQKILKTAGVKTFQQLSVQTITELEAILRLANVRIMNCSTWAEQAETLIKK